MGYDIDPTTPGDNDIVSQYPGNERTNRSTLQDLLGDDHDEGASGSGKHKKVTLKEQGADPTPGASEASLYTKDHGGQPELFFREESSGDIIQITEAGFLYGVLSLLAGSPAAARLLAANLLLTNAIYIQARDNADSEYLDLLQLDAGDFLNVGDAANGSIQKLLLKVAADVANPETKFVVNYGAGDKQIYHEGNKGDADTVDGLHKTGLLTYEVATPLFFESAETVLGGSSTQTTIAHGLGAVPRLWQVVMRCKVVDNNYAVNDEVCISGGSLDPGLAISRGLICYANATNVVIRRGAGNINIPDTAGTWDWQPVTTARWRYVVRAWK